MKEQNKRSLLPLPLPRAANSSQTPPSKTATRPPCRNEQPQQQCINTPIDSIPTASGESGARGRKARSLVCCKGGARCRGRLSRAARADEGDGPTMPRCLRLFQSNTKTKTYLHVFQDKEFLSYGDWRCSVWMLVVGWPLVIVVAWGQAEPTSSSANRCLSFSMSCFFFWW
ncbi:hypothetical protein IF1G_05307 [Cordyceps javanica]|uniref:Uncharacterized protein n=1 Tax=Cordyceps javanica TaxID=43265 RepID=A0A545V176_9HYPO|nr:hypothetical protein IF1G_05307 [Cordyceps javanica]